MRAAANAYFFLLFAFVVTMLFFGGGCAQIGVPSGGTKDTIPPRLIRVAPPDGSRNVSANKFTLDFDEYIDVQDLQQNLLISPLQKKTPTIIINSRSISFKFRDSLLPNTTYTINFGNAVRDINEGNIYKGLSYTFSTGSHLDSLTLGGHVYVAETGGKDSTMIVMLYRDAPDSAVKKIKPSYITRVNGDGSFSFSHLPNAPFKIYALKDENGNKTYSSLSEMFAFAGNEVKPGEDNNIMLYAYIQQKEADIKKALPAKLVPDKKLRVNAALQGTQDLLSPLEIDFNNPLKEADSNKIYLTDTFYRRIAGTKFSIDSTAKKIFLNRKWPPETPLILLVEKDAVKDSAGTELTKADTVHFVTKRNEDYGKLTLRFNGLDLQKNPVLEFISNGEVRFAYPLTSTEWTNNMFPPGDYDIRILFDTDRNGKWTPGNYEKKIQPEISITLPQKLSVRADWDNEREIDM